MRAVVPAATMTELAAPRVRPVPRGQMEIHADTEALARYTARRIAEVAREAIADHGRFTLVLAGGSTPARTYEILASLPTGEGVPWASTEVFFGDERNVPPDDPESNYRMATTRLLAHVPIAADRVHRIEGERPAEDAAERYEATLRRVMAVQPGDPPRFDLVLLGLAPDGHTAALFPGTEAIRERRFFVRAPWVVKLAGRRITLTPAAFNGAARIWFLVTGATKARALAEAVSQPEHAALPVHAIDPVDGELRWVVDSAAATR